MSILSGLRPSSTGIYNNTQPIFRDHYPELVTMPQYFANNGYHTMGGGKIFNQPDPMSWNEYWPSLDVHALGDPNPSRLPANGLEGLDNLDWGPLDDTIRRMGDARLVSEWVVPRLRSDIPEPFFMAVGLSKPHLPWYLPPDVMQTFPSATTMTPDVISDDIEDLPAAAYDFLRTDTHAKITNAGLWESGVAAYLAAGYFADLMLGVLLDAFNDSRYTENTIVVLWSDNGFHVGEKATWHKSTLWHEATRIPLILKVPGIKSPGVACSRAVSLLDVFPTLSELCDLSPCSELEGVSLVGQIQDPKAQRDEPAISTMGQGNHAVITEEWRYIRYRNGDEELYDLTRDPSEWTNLAKQGSLNSVRANLAASLPNLNKVPIE